MLAAVKGIVQGNTVVIEDEDIRDYDGDNLFDAGLIDSLVVIDLVAELNDELNINITAKHIIEENFKTVDNIVTLVESLMN